MKTITYDAVLLIDMQYEFISELRYAELPVLISSQQKILKHCVEADIPVAVLEYMDSGSTICELAVLLKDVPRLQTISKDKDDGFEDTDLHQVLQAWGVKNILLMGINAEYCVKRTANSALQLGYCISTAQSLISGSRWHDPTNCIKWYAKNGTLINV